MRYRMIATAAGLFGLALLWPGTASAQIQHYDVTVHGMVCNQCAYGSEQVFLRTDGVDRVDVDLYNGSVVVYPSETAPILPATVAKKIIDEGVSVERIEAVVRGAIVRRGEGMVLRVAEANLEFPLAVASEEASLTTEVNVDLTVRFEGWEEKKEGSAETLRAVVLARVGQ